MLSLGTASSGNLDAAGVSLSFGSVTGVSNDSEFNSAFPVLEIELQPTFFGSSRQQPPGRPHEPGLLILRSSSSSSDGGGLGI